MCTAIGYKTNDFYFGRTLDYDFSYAERITITPRNYKFTFRNGRISEKHYAIIGMSYIVSNYPLYYDAVNEKGLGIAALNFPGNAFYVGKKEGKINVAPFELIPYILTECDSVKNARKLIENLNIINEKFNEELPVASLHWLISDKLESITLEQTKNGIKTYNNPVSVLTNNPPFDYHIMNLNNYMKLSPESPENEFSKDIDLNPYSRGMGALGLPGDLSSASRFVRASFVKLNSPKNLGETESISQFFHILSSVEQQKGCCKVGEKFEYTIYSSCCNADKGIYYYTTYGNRQISGVDMHKENLESEVLISFPLKDEEQINMQN